MTGLIPGQEYDPDDIERAKKRLDRLGVFSTKQIKEAAYVTPDGQLPLDVIVRENKLGHRNTVVFSPVFGRMDNLQLAEWILKENLPVRLQLQMHKYIWPPDKRGV